MKPTKLIEAKKNSPYRVLDVVFANAESIGMPINHNGTNYHLQCRPLDRTNWLGVRELANALANDTDTMTIMTYENVPITLTKPEVLQAMLNIGAYSQALYGAKWTVRSAINNETDKAKLEAYNVQTAYQQALTAILS